jgi:hypothetical protein
MLGLTLIRMEFFSHNVVMLGIKRTDFLCRFTTVNLYFSKKLHRNCLIFSGQKRRIWNYFLGVFCHKGNLMFLNLLKSRFFFIPDMTYFEGKIFSHPIRVWKLWLDLKGQCHEIFDPRFFRQSITPRPLINTLKYFRILSRIRRAIRPLSLIPRYAA